MELQESQTQIFLNQFLNNKHDLTQFQQNGNGNLRLIGRIFKICNDQEDLSKIYLSREIDITDPQNPIQKPYVFFMGGDGMEYILRTGKDNVYQSMIHVGLARDYLLEQIYVRKNQFYLIIMTEQIGFPATWGEIEKQILVENPELIEYYEKYDKNQLRSKEVFQSDNFKSTYKNFSNVDNSNIMVDPDIYLTPKRFLQRTQKKIEDFRVLMWTWFGMNHLFQGNGYTHTEDGQQGCSEYYVPNNSIQYYIDNYDAKIVKLDIIIPEN